MLVKPIKPEQKTAGGVWVPDEVHERDEAAAEHGILIASGELAFTVGGSPKDPGFFVYDIRPEPGGKVAFTRYAGAKIKGNDGEEYRLMNDDDVTAILENANG